MSASASGRPVVFGIERVNNPHILPIFEELYRQPGIEFVGAVLQRQPPWRVALGWPELGDTAPFLQFWRTEADQQRYFELAHEADIVIWPGLKHPRGIRLLRWRNLHGKPNLIWAERFIGRRKRSAGEQLAMKLTVRLVNTDTMHLMSMGPGAEVDYRLYGANRWRCWSMGYAVRPIIDLDHDLNVAPDGNVRLLFVGELSVRKGCDILLKALASASVRSGPWLLDIIGDGSERAALEALAESSGIREKVRFVGMVPRSGIDEVYARADVLILPSRFDGWGAAINEAMEHGVAVVASQEVGAAHELVAEGINGYVVAVEDITALADRLARLVEDRGLCTSMRRASRERIVRFRPEVVAARIAAFCRGLTGHGSMPEYRDGFCTKIPN